MSGLASAEMPLLNRRSFLRRSGVAAAAVAVGPALRLGSAAAAEGRSRLAPARTRTYAALVGAVAAADSPHLGRDYDQLATKRFVDWYGGSSSRLRAGADALLDAVERGRP